MLLIADEGDGSCLFQALKRPVFDFSAQAKVFLQRLVWHGEGLIVADDTPPVQPNCNGQLLFGVHQRQYTLQPFNRTTDMRVRTAPFRHRAAFERFYLDSPSVP